MLLERVRIELRLDVRACSNDFKERPQPTSERFFTWYQQTNSKTGGVSNWDIRSRRGPGHGAGAPCRRIFRLKKRARRSVRRDRQHAAAATSSSRSPRPMIMVLPPPPVRGVGRAGGFMIMIEDRSVAGSLEGSHPRGCDRRPGRRGQFDTDPETGKKQAAGVCHGMTSVFRANVPQVYVDVDRSAGMTKEVDAPGCLPDACRSTWARSTSTTSTCSAAPGRSSSSASPSSATRSMTSTG